MYFPAGFGACGSLAGGITFKDYGAVEDVAAEREV